MLGLMRQESSFDPAIISAAGAVGLMQLMPDTARQVGGQEATLTDPPTNMRLGTVYLQRLLARFDNAVPYAIAAYNAGPRHVHEWIATNGDAAAAGRNDDMLDWIEQIPKFAETRNYVQRVLENRASTRPNLHHRRAPRRERFWQRVCAGGAGHRRVAGGLGARRGRFCGACRGCCLDRLGGRRDVPVAVRAPPACRGARRPRRRATIRAGW